MLLLIFGSALVIFLVLLGGTAFEGFSIGRSVTIKDRDRHAKRHEWWGTALSIFTAIIMIALPLFIEPRLRSKIQRTDTFIGLLKVHIPTVTVFAVATATLVFYTGKTWKPHGRLGRYNVILGCVVAIEGFLMLVGQYVGTK